MEAGLHQQSLSLSFTPTQKTLMGKYQFGRLLGRGNFGKVYQARSLFQNDCQDVAVKIIDKNKTINVDMETRIIREISAMKRLQYHPNVIKIHEVMASKTKIYLVVELATGGELFSKISGRRRLRESAARKYFQQLVSALNFCHKNGVTHRDIKPQNLLLDDKGNLKISDFGLSALPEQLNNGLLHTACGTPAYTAPEVVSRRGYDGSKTDAWSCGVILYVLLAGQVPFDDSNITDMYRKIHRRDYAFPECISKPARSIIFRLLDPNPKTRMSMEKLMQTAWFKISLQADPEISMFKTEIESVWGKNYKTEIESVPNAFDIISLSSGLNLSGLFEATNWKEKRFTTRLSTEVMIEKVREVGLGLGFRVERGKGWSIGLGKGKVILIVEIMEIAEALLIGGLKVLEGGFEFEELHWAGLKSGLQEFVVSWA